MAQATFSIRMDETLKKQFEISSPIDNTRSEAKAAFYEMRQIAAENGLTDMTLDEINAEINAVRSRK